MTHQTKSFKFLYLSLSLITIISTIPLLITGFTAADDLDVFLIRNIPGSNIFLDALNYAKGMGRFFWLITRPMYVNIYLIESMLVIRIFATLFIISNYILSSVIIYKVFNNKEIAILYYVICMASYQIVGENSLYVAYPVYFSFSLFLIQLSVFLYLKLKHTHLNLWLLSFLFIFGVLFYEAYFVYLMIFVLGVAISNFITHKKIFITLKKTFFNVYPFIIFGIFYLTIYLFYKHKFPTAYDGTMVAEDLPIGILIKTVFNFASGAIPLVATTHYNQLILLKSDIAIESSFGIFTFIKRLEIEWILNSVLVFGISYYILNRIRFNRNWIFSMMVVFGVLVALIIQVPIGLTHKYILWSENGAWNYVTTYFSHFGIILILIPLILIPLHFFGKIKFIRKIYIILTSIALGILSLKTNYSNNYIAKDLRQTQLKFSFIDKIITSDYFTQLPDNIITLGESLWQYNTMSNLNITGQGFHWNNYILAKTGKDIGLKRLSQLPDIEDEVKKGNFYFIHFNQQFKSDHQYACMARISNVKYDSLTNSTLYLADTIKVYYYSSYTNFSLSIPVFNEYQTNGLISIDEKQFLPKGAGNWVNVKYFGNYNDIKEFTISHKNIVLKDIVLSNFIKPDAQTITLRY